MSKTSAAIIGSGNIGTDLMMKIMQRSEQLEVVAMIGIDPKSAGLARAVDAGIAVTSEGIEGFLQMPQFAETSIVFDATSASAHLKHAAILKRYDKQLIDLTPAAIGPYVVPTVNLDEHLSNPNVNLVTCGGQATIPIVAAVNQVAPVLYAEIVASISSRSAGPGTRANIDEFTQTTARGIEVVGQASHGKAIIVLNPAEPAILMRNTVFCFVEGEPDLDAIDQSIQQMVARVQSYVPGYRLKQSLLFDRFDLPLNPFAIPGLVEPTGGVKVTTFLEVEGAGDFLPNYAGNLDIMTSAALATAERFVELRHNASTANPISQGASDERG